MNIKRFIGTDLRHAVVIMQHIDDVVKDVPISALTGEKAAHAHG